MDLIGANDLCGSTNLFVDGDLCSVNDLFVDGDLCSGMDLSALLIFLVCRSNRRY